MHHRQWPAVTSGDAHRRSAAGTTTAGSSNLLSRLTSVTDRMPSSQRNDTVWAHRYTLHRSEAG